MSEDVTDTNVKDEPVTVSPGGGMNFDQLEALEVSTTNDEIEDAISQVKADSTKEIVADALEESNGEVTPEVKAKIIKALAGEEEIEIPGDAIITHGDNKFSLQQIVDSAIGEAEVDRRFSELDKEKEVFAGKKKLFDTDVSLIDNKLKEIVKLSDGGDYLGVMRLVATLSGHSNPIEFRKKLAAQARESANQMADMTEEEVEAFWKSEELKEAERTSSKKIELLQSKVDARDNQDKLVKLVAVEGVSMERFSKAYKDLLTDPAAKKRLESLTPEAAVTGVAIYCKDLEKSDRVTKACTEMKVEDQKVVDELFKVLDYEDTVEDIKDILKEYLDDAASEDKEVEEPEKKVEVEAKPKKILSKKAAKPVSSEKVASKGKETKEEEVDEDDVIGFDDLTEKYGR